MTNSICNLCKLHTADKKNSHIIPRFLSKALFDYTEPRHAISIDRNYRKIKIQDTPKEDYILCVVCEKRIEILETYFARVLNEIHSYKSFPEKYIVNSLVGQQYLDCKSIHPTLYKLFIYSIVWRTSISNLTEFKSFKIPTVIEEELRVFLDDNLTVDQSTLLQSLNRIVKVPLYHSCLMKPKEKSRMSRGIFSATSLNEYSHLFLLVDFALFFYTDEDSIGEVIGRFSNKQNQNVYVVLGESDPWHELNKVYYNKMMRE